MLHLKYMSTKCISRTTSYYALSRNTELRNNIGTAGQKSPVTANPLPTTSAFGTVKIEPLSYAFANIWHPSKTFANIEHEPHGSSILVQNELSKFFLAIVSPLSKIILLVSKTVVDKVLTLFYAQILLLHLYYGMCRL